MQLLDEVAHALTRSEDVDGAIAANSVHWPAPVVGRHLIRF
jgi:hypothetical protein